MLIVLLVVGLWIATDPESTLRRLRQLGIGIQQFVNALLGLYTPGGLAYAETQDSRGMCLAMRLFGIAIAALAFAGLCGIA
jgi:hypothetical protein